MKLKLIASAFLLASLPFAAQASVVKTEFKLPTIQATKTVDSNWQTCVEFILSHSTNFDLMTLSRLNLEVALGVKTWQLIGTQANGDGSLLVSGPGLGWPGTKMVVEFGSAEDAQTAGNMLMNATADSTRD